MKTTDEETTHKIQMKITRFAKQVYSLPRIIKYFYSKKKKVTNTVTVTDIEFFVIYGNSSLTLKKLLHTNI